jgi:hypothetical protein
MTQKGTGKTFGRITGALENRPLETSLHQKNGWLRMMAGQFREWRETSSAMIG